MNYLIDGHNLIARTPGLSLADPDDEAKLVRLSARDGARVWSVDLPRYTTDHPRRIKTVMPSYGPVLASGKLDRKALPALVTAGALALVAAG